MFAATKRKRQTKKRQPNNHPQFVAIIAVNFIIDFKSISRTIHILDAALAAIGIAFGCLIAANYYSSTLIDDIHILMFAFFSAASLSMSRPLTGAIVRLENIAFQIISIRFQNSLLISSAECCHCCGCHYYFYRKNDIKIIINDLK